MPCGQCVDKGHKSDPDLGRKRVVWFALLRNKPNYLPRKAIWTAYLRLSLDRFVASPRDDGCVS